MLKWLSLLSTKRSCVAAFFHVEHDLRTFFHLGKAHTLSMVIGRTWPEADIDARLIERMEAQALGFGIPEVALGIQPLLRTKESNVRLAVEHHARHIVAVGLHEVIMQAAVLILQIGLQDERMDKVELLRGDKQARAARAALTRKSCSRGHLPP